MKHLVFGKTWKMVFNKDLFSVHFYKIYIYVIFFYSLEDLDTASYADDTTIHTLKENKESAINILEAL